MMLTASVAALDWARIGAELDADGRATTGPLLPKTLCAALSSAYDSDALFRSRVVMARHGYGRGEYRYYAYPLPEPVQALRSALYPHLASIANGWAAALGGADTLSRPAPRVSGVLPRARPIAAPRRCCCATAPATTTACTRTFTATCTSRCRSPSC